MHIWSTHFIGHQEIALLPRWSGVMSKIMPVETGRGIPMLKMTTRNFPIVDNKILQDSDAQAIWIFISSVKFERCMS